MGGVFMFIPCILFAQTFTDVSIDNDNYEAIEYFYQQDVIQGYDDHTFHPDQKVNRVEALKIILLGSKINISEKNIVNIFDDVLGDEWYAEYVYQAKILGIVKGNTDGTFAPERTVNYAEALKMVLMTNSVNLPLSIEEDPFSDVMKDEWYARYFDYAKHHNIININSNDAVFPARKLTRGDIISLMYKVYLSEKISDISSAEIGYATYYADYFQGENTASGESFDQNKLTAAHRTYPFGTKVRVTNSDSGKSVIVTINDRGPFNPDRIIDLSSSAFKTLAPLSRGVLAVKLEVVSDNVFETKNNVRNMDVYENLLVDRDHISIDGFQKIELDKEIPQSFFKLETYVITGEVLDSDESIVNVFLTTDTGRQYNYSGNVINNRFNIPVIFPEKGVLKLGIVLGNEGQSHVYDVQVIDYYQMSENLVLFDESPKNIKLRLQDNDTLVSWEGQSSLVKISIIQGQNKIDFILNNNQNEFIIPLGFLSDLVISEAYIQVGFASSKSDFSLDQSSLWNFSEPYKINIIPHIAETINNTKLELISVTDKYSLGTDIQLKANAMVKIKPQSKLIMPDGKVVEVDLKLTELNQDLTLIEFNYTPQESGTYIISIYDELSEIVLIYPVYFEDGSFPLFPDKVDVLSNQIMNLINFNISEMRQHMIEIINRDRVKNNVLPVAIDNNLNELAQARADDMVKKKYFGHITPLGKTVNDLRLEYDVQTFINENISKNNNIELAQNRFMMSGAHRSNIIYAHWNRVGVGISQLDKQSFVIVQLFSENLILNEDISDLRVFVLQEISDFRSQKGQLALIPNVILNNIAQSWSERMARDDFVGHTDVEGQSINDLIKSSGVEDDVMSLFIAVNSFYDFLELVKQKEEFLEINWQTIGIGITQSNTGVIKIAILFSK